jgi:hypothetical protein
VLLKSRLLLYMNLRFLDFVDLSDETRRAAHIARIHLRLRHESLVTLQDYEYMPGIAVSHMIDVKIEFDHHQALPQLQP